MLALSRARDSAAVGQRKPTPPPMASAFRPFPCREAEATSSQSDFTLVTDVEWWLLGGSRVDRRLQSASGVEDGE
jgi:hypothetical protein